MIDYVGPGIFDSPKIDNDPFTWWFTLLQELAKCIGFRLIVAFSIGTEIYVVLG